jgi:hypothetical protein
MMGFASGFFIKAHLVQVSLDIPGLCILLPALCTELQRGLVKFFTAAVG